MTGKPTYTELEKRVKELEEASFDRGQSEEMMLESEKPYQKLVEITSEGYWLVDSKSRTIEVNQALCDMLGYSQEEIIGKLPLDFAETESRKIFISQNLRIFDIPNRSYDLILKKKTGDDVYVHFSATTIKDQSGEVKGVFALITDITDRKRAEEERGRLATAIEQVADCVVITDKDANIQYVNPAFTRITGYTEEEAIGQNPRLLKSGKHDEAFYKKMWDTFSRGEIWKGHLINKKKDKSLYEEETTISPVKNTEGAITNYVAVKRDITQEMKTEDRLRQAQKMEAIGTLAGGIAHDFNNILAGITGYAFLAKQRLGRSDPIFSNLGAIEKLSRRGAELTKSLLAFSRQGEFQPGSANMNRIAEEVLEMIKRRTGEKVEIKAELEKELPDIAGEEGLLHQILMNICINACDAMPEGGLLALSTGRVSPDQVVSSLLAESGVGDLIMIKISDTGIGMDDEIKARIFEPFFTTKDDKSGTGLGLSIVNGIVEKHGGWIEVESTPGLGSEFTIYFPVDREVHTQAV